MFKVEYRYTDGHPKAGNLVSSYPNYFRRPATYQSEKTLNRLVPDWKLSGPLTIDWDCHTKKYNHQCVERFTYRHDGNDWVRIN